MKKITFFLLTCTAFMFTGCFETTEELTINKNGSGTYHYAMDFKGLFDMLDAMKAMDTSGKADMGIPKERKDTTINLRSFTDTATSLTSEQKELYQNATLNLLMDGTEKEFKVAMNMPFQKLGDVEKLVKVMSSDEGGNMLSKLFKESKTLGNAGSDDNPGKLPDLNSYYDLSVKKGNIERRLNQAKYDSVMQLYGSQMPAESMGEMLGSINLNTIIHLPKAAKKISGANATVSADKKTITIKGTLADLFKNPQVFSYRIEY
jgi:hypothetical protein